MRKKKTRAPIPAAEPLLDARQAAYHLNLPLYFLTQAAKRKELKIPHYRVGRLLRFKLSALDAWLLANAASDLKE